MKEANSSSTLKVLREPDYNKIDNIAVIYYYSDYYTHNEDVSPFEEVKVFAPPPLSFFSKLYYIVDGECTIQINEKQYQCKKNDLILIPANIKMSFIAINNAKWYWIHFNVLFKINTIYADLFNNFTDNFFLHADGLFPERYTQEIHKHSDLITPIDEFLVKCNLMQLIRFYIKKTNLQPTLSDQHNPLYQINQYMIEHLRSGVTNKDLAQIVNMNINYFIRWFKKQTGYTPIQYYNYRKIELARGMLDHSDRPLSDILESLGFLDHSYFSRLFKKYIGISPSEYRKNSIFRNSN